MSFDSIMVGVYEIGGRKKGHGPIDYVTGKAIEIYERKYKNEFENSYNGHYVVIDINSEKAYVHKDSAQAYLDARKEDPIGLFVLLRIGSHYESILTK